MGAAFSWPLVSRRKRLGARLAAAELLAHPQEPAQGVGAGHGESGVGRLSGGAKGRRAGGGVWKLSGRSSFRGGGVGPLRGGTIRCAFSLEGGMGVVFWG